MAGPASSFRVGQWTVEPALNRVSRDGGSTQLELKVMDVLVCLAEHAGEVVPREIIVDTVWATEFIADNTLTHAIAEIRRALGDDARDPQYIETIPKRGYRLIAPVTVETATVTPFPTTVSETRRADERSPYPGLAAFTEDDAEFFFGREAEVAQLWRKLTSRRLLAVIGPSGVGKSSFLRAGVIPAAPDGWATCVITPGESPFTALARGLVYQFSGDAPATEQLVDLRDPARAIAMVARWRDRHHRALLVVDQFEELFTLTPGAVQTEFAGFLRRLVDEAGIHALLVMRDDFLHRCHEVAGLAPVFDSLTPIAQPDRESLRSALVDPAARLGYEFEDADLVDEMVDEVAETRAALPLLAFAVARLWDARDRERHLLTPSAYEAIGGVGGALAQHAESTLKAIGTDRLPIVREMFRNLVTAQGTRAVRESDELLSVFDEQSRPAARDVLDRLVDARLLTTFEEDSTDVRRHRVEMVHEALLTSWPRLVRWRTQDADAAQLRDQLRQAARTWDERQRPDDLLWTGTAFREFAVWRERYPGGLSDTEEAFAEAMTRVATRRRRRRRVAVVAAFAVLVAVSAIVGMSRQQAVAEARRAEAGKLLVLGRMQLEDDPTAALAYARASLDLADTPEARRYAVEVLWSGPVARMLPVKRMAREAGLAHDPDATPVLSPDGRWLATTDNRQVLLFPSDGGPPRALPRQPDGNVNVLAFGPRGEVLVTGGSGSSMRFWSLPDLRELRSVELGGVRSVGGNGDGGNLFTWTWMDEEPGSVLLRIWPLPDGEPQVMEDLPGAWDTDLRVSVVANHRGRQLLVRPAEARDGSKERVLGDERVLGEAADLVQDLAVAPGGDRVASLDRSGEVRVWSTAGHDAGPTHVLQGPRAELVPTGFDPTGRYVAQGAPNTSLLLWDVDGPPGTEPRVVRRRVPAGGWGYAFDHDGRWVVTNFGEDEIELWSLETPWARTFRDVSSTIWSMAFTDDRRWLAVCPVLRPAQLWPLHAADGAPRDLNPPEPCASVATHPAREELLVGTSGGDVLLYPLPEGPPRRLAGGFGGMSLGAAAFFDLEARRVVAGPAKLWGGSMEPEARALRVWDLDSGQERVYSLAHLTDPDWMGLAPQFARDGRIYAPLGRGDRLMRLTLPAGPAGEISAEPVLSAGSLGWFLNPGGRFLPVLASQKQLATNFEYEQLLLYDLETGTSRRITTHGTRLSQFAAVDPTGRILVTGDIDGVVRAGPVTGEEPHLLLGHQGMITGITISPDGRWIASASDESVRLWPMPDVTKPPLHALPHDELLATLDELTNLRAVRDDTSSTGWTLEVGPFPGWETVPSW